MASLEHKVEAREKEISSMKGTVAEAQRAMKDCIAEHAAKTKQIEQYFADKELKLQSHLRK